MTQVVWSPVQSLGSCVPDLRCRCLRGIMVISYGLANCSNIQREEFEWKTTGSFQITADLGSVHAQFFNLLLRHGIFFLACLDPYVGSKNVSVHTSIVSARNFRCKLHWKTPPEISDVQKLFLCMVGILIRSLSFIIFPKIPAILICLATTIVGWWTFCRSWTSKVVVQARWNKKISEELNVGVAGVFKYSNIWVFPKIGEPPPPNHPF